MCLVRLFINFSVIFNKALLFIFKQRFPPGVSIATIFNNIKFCF
jgi:hypothetical protein